MFGLFKSKRKEKIAQYLKEGATLLDVRTAAEYNDNNISGSLNIPVQTLGNHVTKLDVNKPVITYCAHGGRSTMAAIKLRGMGFKVVDAGGINSVRKAMK
jgi:rhodanese-related sulfurtransferase